VTEFFDVFLQNIFPIFLVATMGYVLRRRMDLDTKALSTLTFYVLSPALVFSSLVKTRLDGDELIQIALFALIVTLAMGVVGLVISLVLKLPRPTAASLLLVLMFVNAGNYGLTLNELRFGEEGLARAIVFFVVSTLVIFTFGVFIASLGRSNVKESFSRFIKLPAFYAVVLAILFYLMDLSVPDPIMSGIEIAGAGAIPVMLIVLGMQIADLKSLESVWQSIPASLVRLLVAPVIAVLVANLVGLNGLARTTSIIEASMPTAVFTTILAVEFNVRPGFVTSTVAISTLLSAITLPIIITLLGF
jgi:predicted permease